MNMHFIYCFNAATAARFTGASVLAACYWMPAPLNAELTRQ